MKKLSVNELEALMFFGVEPVKAEPDEPWYDTDSVYEVRHDSGLCLTCALHPIVADVRLRLLLKDALLFEWHAMGLKDVQYVEDAYGCFMEFIASDTDKLVLRLTPEFQITRHSGASFRSA